MQLGANCATTTTKTPTTTTSSVVYTNPIQATNANSNNHQSSSSLSQSTLGLISSQDWKSAAKGQMVLLTEEEKRTLIAEGYAIPQRFPLSKSEERSLKKVRRKIKNKISAQESRRKKKEYLEELERRCEEMECRIMELERENNLLNSLRNNNTQLIANSDPTTTTTTRLILSSSSILNITQAATSQQQQEFIIDNNNNNNDINGGDINNTTGQQQKQIKLIANELSTLTSSNINNESVAVKEDLDNDKDNSDVLVAAETSIQSSECTLIVKQEDHDNQLDDKKSMSNRNNRSKSTKQ